MAFSLIEKTDLLKKVRLPSEKAELQSALDSGGDKAKWFYDEKKFSWPNGYKNFKMAINKDNTYTYSLKEGISEVMMAIDMMESYGFPENVVKDARLIVKKLNKKKYI